jgi:hypothetical protein
VVFLVSLLGARSTRFVHRPRHHSAHLAGRLGLQQDALGRHLRPLVEVGALVLSFSPLLTTSAQEIFRFVPTAHHSSHTGSRLRGPAPERFYSHPECAWRVVWLRYTGNGGRPRAIGRSRRANASAARPQRRPSIRAVLRLGRQHRVRYGICSHRPASGRHVATDCL